MIAIDTSVAVAAFGDWHCLNEPACAVVDEGVVVPAHALLETFAVLTGFPPPHRAPPALVVAWLDDRFPDVLAPPPASEHGQLLRRLAAAGRAGGSVYDAIVGLTARLAGATLVTADDRVAAVYEMVGVEVRRLIP